MAWISRLTLIAYFVGGWLLPATHYHARHDGGACQHVHDRTSVSSSDTSCGQTEGDKAKRCCGHTDHDKSVSDDARPATDQYYEAASRQLACSGLCALCSARSLATTTLQQSATRFELRKSSQSDGRPESTLLPRPLASEHFSRGPPEIV